MRQFQVAVIAGAADEVVVHKFDRRRVEAGFDQFRYEGRRFGHVREDGQDVEFIRRQGNEFQRRFGDDAQGPFGTDDELVQAEAGRALLQGSAEVDDFARRQDGFDGIDLMARRTIADGFIAAGVGSQVAADEAAVGTAGVAGIEQAFFVGCILDVDSADAGFDGHIHAIFIQFDDVVHPFHEQNDALISRDGATADAGTGTARRDRDVEAVGNLHDFRNFLGIRRQDNDFRRLPEGRCQAFIGFIDVQDICIGLDIFIADDSFQCVDNFSCNWIVFFHCKNPFTF